MAQLVGAQSTLRAGRCWSPRPRRIAEKAENEGRNKEFPHSAQTSHLLRSGLRHLVLANTRGSDKRGVAFVCHICRGYLCRHSELISTLDSIVTGGSCCSAYSHRRSEQGLCRVRQRERTPCCRSFPRRQRRCEVGTGTAHQLDCCERIRAIHARLGLQYFSHRRHDCASVPEQYGPWWPALPHHTFSGL